MSINSTIISEIDKIQDEKVEIIKNKIKDKEVIHELINYDCVRLLNADIYYDCYKLFDSYCNKNQHSFATYATNQCLSEEDSKLYEIKFKSGLFRYETLDGKSYHNKEYGYYLCKKCPHSNASCILQ